MTMTTYEINLRNEELANDIIDWLKKNRLNTDTRIYTNGKAYDTNKNKWLDNMDPSEYVEYYNKEGITMTFESSLYKVLNDYSSPKLYDEFKSLLAKYGAYFIPGFSWSLSVYFD